MIRSLLVILLASVPVALAVEINIPAGWTELEVPTERPASIKSMTRVLAPNEDAEVSINEMEIVMSLDEAAESYIRGAAKNGFRYSSTSEVTHDGYESRKITGVFPLPDGLEEIPIEAYIILAPNSMLSVGVIGPEASSKINDVLGWIELPTVETNSTTETAAVGAGRSLWEYLGIGLVLAALGYAVITAKSRKNEKENKMLR